MVTIGKSDRKTQAIQSDQGLQELLAQQTAQHLFLFSNNARSFETRFEDWYTQIRKELLSIVSRGLNQEDEELKRKTESVHESLLDLEYSKCKATIARHNDGEIGPKAQSNVRQRHIDIMHFIGDDPNASLMELLLTCDMLNRADAERINVYLPYLPYSRQDRKEEGRVPIAARLVIDLIETSCNGKLGRIVIADLHAAQEQGFSKGPVDNLSIAPLFARYLASREFYDEFGVELRDITLISPDVGGAKRAQKISKILDIPYMVYEKDRPMDGEVEVDESKINTIETPFGVFIDDIIDTAGTLIESAEATRRKFGLQGVFALATHGRFSPKRNKDTQQIQHYAEDRLRESGIIVITTDTIPRDDSYLARHSSWLRTISLSEYLANIAILNRLGHSVSNHMRKMEMRVRETINSGQRTDMNEYLIQPRIPNGAYNPESNGKGKNV